MKLRQLTIKDISGVPNRAFSFCERDGTTVRPVTLVTGGPRSGKSSLLRAVTAAKEAVGAYGAAPHPMKLIRPGAAGRISATWALSNSEQAATREKEQVTVDWDIATGELPEVGTDLQKLFARFSRNPEHSKMELFAARRSLDVAAETPLLPGMPDEQEGRQRLRSTGAKYTGILRALNDAVLRYTRRTAEVLEEQGVAFRRDLPDSLARYKSAVSIMCPSVRLAAVEPRERTRPLIWFDAKTGGRVELADLSDSELQGALFALAFVWLGLNGSIVLIDTPELHVHPEEQARFFRAICELGKDNQIIAATTSPEILRSVAPEQIIDLTRREKAA